jgi:hypothetical protein
MLSARSAYIKLDLQEEMEFSPALHAARIGCPLLLAYAGHDPDEFQRHSRDFAAALRASNRLSYFFQMT